MADVTGAPVPTGASEFDVPGDMQALADHFGDATEFAVANAAALPSSGNWAGRTLMTNDTKTLYMWTGAAWIVVNGGAYSVAVGTAQSIPNNTITDVIFTGGAAVSVGPPLFTSVLATGVVTAALAGVYRIRGKVVWASGGSVNSHVLGVSINNGSVVEATVDAINTVTTQQIEVVVTLSAGDNVRLKVIQVSGGAKDIFVAGGNYLTRFSIERLA